MASMVEDLSNPASLPDGAKTVSVIQTHISIVFLADEFVYKIKKPVDFGFLDFATLEKRHYYCQQEVTLNRRLSKMCTSLFYLFAMMAKFTRSRKGRAGW